MYLLIIHYQWQIITPQYFAAVSLSHTVKVGAEVFVS